MPIRCFNTLFVRTIYIISRNAENSTEMCTTSKSLINKRKLVLLKSKCVFYLETGYIWNSCSVLISCPTPLIYGVNLIKTISFNEIVSIRARYPTKLMPENQFRCERFTEWDCTRVQSGQRGRGVSGWLYLDIVHAMMPCQTKWRRKENGVKTSAAGFLLSCFGRSQKNEYFVCV